METRSQMTLNEYLETSLKDPVEVKIAQDVLNCIGTQPNFISDVPIDTLKQILNDKDNMIYRWVCIDEDRWLSRQVCGCYNIPDLKYNMEVLDRKYKMKNAVKHILFAPFEPFIQPNTVYSTSMENFILATEEKLEPKLSTENSYQEAIENIDHQTRHGLRITFEKFIDTYLPNIYNFNSLAPYTKISAFFEIEKSVLITDNVDKSLGILKTIKNNKLGCRWMFISHFESFADYSLDTVGTIALERNLSNIPDHLISSGYFIFSCTDVCRKNLYVISGKELKDLIKEDKTPASEEKPKPTEPKSLKDMLSNFGIDITNELQETNMKDKSQQAEMTFNDFLKVLELYFENNHGNISIGKAAENFLTMAAPGHLSYKWALYGNDVLGDTQYWTGTGKLKALINVFNDINKNNNIEYILFYIASETIGSDKTVSVLTTREFLDVVIPMGIGMPDGLLDELKPYIKQGLSPGQAFLGIKELLKMSEKMIQPNVIGEATQIKVNVNVENNEGCFIVGIGQAKNLSDEQKHSIKEFAMAINKQNFNHSISQVVFNFKTPSPEVKEPCTGISAGPVSNMHIFVKQNLDKWVENTSKLNDFLNHFFGPKTDVVTGIMAQSALSEIEEDEEYCKWLIIGNFHNELDIEEILDPLNDLDLKSFCNHLSENGICLDKVIYVAFERPSNDEALYILTPDELLESLDTIQATIADQFKKRSLNIKNLR